MLALPMLALVACSDDPPPAPSRASVYVKLQSQLGDLAHSNAMSCDQMAEAIEAWLAKNGEEYRALSEQAARGELKAKLGGGLIGASNDARAKLKVYAGQCVPKSARLRALAPQLGL